MALLKQHYDVPLNSSVGVSASLCPLRFTLPVGTTSSAVDSLAWSVPSEPFMSSNRKEWKLPTRTTTASLLSEPPVTTQVSCSSIATRARASGTSGLSVLVTPFLFSGPPPISALPYQSGHNGVRTTRLDGPRVSWSTIGERPAQLTANPQLQQPVVMPQPQPAVNPQPAASFLLGLQVPPINKFSGEERETLFLSGWSSLN